MQDYQKYFVNDEPSPFSEAGSVTHKECPSDKIDRVNCNGKPGSIMLSARNDSHLP